MVSLENPVAEKQRRDERSSAFMIQPGGTVKFNDREISGKMNKELHQYITDNIAMIFQDPIASLNPRMTVQEIIAEGLKIRGVKDPEELQHKSDRECWSMWDFRQSMHLDIRMSSLVVSVSVLV